MKKLTPPGYFDYLSLACAESASDGSVKIFRSVIQEHGVTIKEHVDDDHIEKKTVSSLVFTQSYTIAVPVELEDINGNRESKFRLQLQRRNRTIQGSEVDHYKELPTDVVTVSANKLRFFKPNHSPVSISKALDSLQLRAPVALIREDKPLDLFYQEMLNPNMLVILDERGLIPELVSVQAG